MIRQISRRSQITLPKKLLLALGAGPLDYVRVEKKGTAIVLVPVALEEKVSDHEWVKLKKHLENAKKGARFVSADEAKRQISSL